MKLEKKMDKDRLLANLNEKAYDPPNDHELAIAELAVRMEKDFKRDLFEAFGFTAGDQWPEQYYELAWERTVDGGMKEVAQHFNDLVLERESGATPLNFADLRLANKERQKAWDPNKRITLLYSANELAGEVGEACNIVKKLERKALGIKGSEGSIFDLADELADVVICADLVAMRAGIDLGASIVQKFNRTSKENDLPATNWRIADYGSY